MTSLKLHMKLRSNTKHHQCNVCAKLFKNYTVMVVHKRIHFGEKPKICMKCGEGFACLSSLKTHYQLHMKARCDALASYDINASATLSHTLNVPDQNSFQESTPQGFHMSKL